MNITLHDTEFLSNFTLVEFLISLTLSLCLSLMIKWVYTKTHTGLSYSRTFTLTLVMMAMTISFIMLIIGSNLARAFSLVGALSIIRYRNAVKEPRDIAYVFLAMAIGMACGVKFYAMAAIFTVFSSVVLLVLEKVNLSSASRVERLVQVSSTLDQDLDALEKRFHKDSNGKFHLVSSEAMSDRKVTVYSLKVKSKQMRAKLVDEYKEIVPEADVKVIRGVESFNI